MDEILARAALRRCGNNPRTLRAAIDGYSRDLAAASNPDTQRRFRVVIAALRERLTLRLVG